jgi:hypothetical protein
MPLFKKMCNFHVQYFRETIESLIHDEQFTESVHAIGGGGCAKSKRNYIWGYMNKNG